MSAIVDASIIAAPNSAKTPRGAAAAGCTRQRQRLPTCRATCRSSFRMRIPAKRAFCVPKVRYRGMPKNANRLFVPGALANLFVARHDLFIVQRP